MAALDISSVLCTWFAWSNQLIRLASLILNLACSAGDSRYPIKILHLAVSTMKTYLTFARISLKYSFWFHSASRWVLKRKIRQDVDCFVSISDTVEILWKHCDCRSRIHELLIRWTQGRSAKERKRRTTTGSPSSKHQRLCFVARNAQYIPSIYIHNKNGCLRFSSRIWANVKKAYLTFFCQFSPTNSTTFEFYVKLVSSSVESVASDNRYILSACHSVVSE